MNRTALSVFLGMVVGCNKGEVRDSDAPTLKVEPATLRAQAPAAPIEDDPLISANVPVVRHGAWKIGDTDSGEFTEIAEEAAQRGHPRKVTESRNVPRGLVHRYDFQVTKTGWVIALVHQHAFVDERATPVMALFKDDGTRDKQLIPLTARETPEPPFELEQLPSGSYEVEDGFGLVAQGLEPGFYVLLVKPASRDAFVKRARGAKEPGLLEDSTFVCMSKCQHCQ